MLWKIQSFPLCTHHAFLSHCAEDRGWLFPRLIDGLQSQGIIPWLDRHHYPTGRPSLEALRDGLLKCRHIVFLITQGMLAQSRGWTVIELAWADILQSNMQIAGGALRTAALPLYFVEQDHLNRFAWSALRDKGVFHQPAMGDAVDWAIDQITSFVIREQSKANDLAVLIEQDPILREQVLSQRGLKERVEAMYP